MKITKEDVEWAKRTSSYLEDLDRDFMPVQFPGNNPTGLIRSLNQRTPGNVSWETLRLWDVEDSTTDEILWKINQN